MRVSFFLYAASVLLIVGCNSHHELENYGDISQGPGGIALVDPSEHKGGWGRSDCLVCHNVSLNVHRGENSAISDPDELNRIIKENGESAYCLNCHGPNGLQ